MALTGNETLQVLGTSLNGAPAATTFTTTTGAIATLAAVGGSDTQTAITTAIGTTLPASALVSGLIGRSGPTAPFTDTTDTAAAIAAAGEVGGSFYIAIKNLTAFSETIVGGTGVTVSSSPIIPANSNGTFLIVVTSASAVTIYHVDTVPLTSMLPTASTALTTVGAGTITGAGIAGAFTLRSGSTAAFTDTTDTAAAIILAQPNVHVGSSWEYIYQNNTVAPATITGGSGVTVSGITVVPPNMTARYLVTYTAASTVTMVGISLGLAEANSGTFVATAASAVTVANTFVTATSTIIFGLKTIGGTPAGAPYMATVTPGTGFTVKAFAGDTSTYNYTIIG